jgi:hypothetical protein
MLQLETVANFDEGGHHFRVVRPQDEEAFLSELAEEYLLLRTATTCDVKDISIDGIGVVSAEAILERLKRATIPERGKGSFSVVRSDFGETLAYTLLTQEYGTRFGYKSVRDRELIQLPGRGIDAVGVERSPLTLVFGETKVSAEAKSPPQVVDYGKDCLREQHRGHISEREATANKVFDLARKSVDPEVQDLLFAATLGFEGKEPIVLRIAASSTLVRPECHHTADDFGSFRASPTDFAPAMIRFWILRTDSPIEEIVDRWHTKVMELVAS